MMSPTDRGRLKNYEQISYGQEETTFYSVKELSWCNKLDEDTVSVNSVNGFNDLQSLELRRLHVDLIWCYKVVFGLVDTDMNDFFKFNTRTTSHII